MFMKVVALCQIYGTLSASLEKEFVPITNNKKWIGNELVTVNVRSLMECSTSCLFEERCNSFNYIDVGHGGLKTCELKDGWCQDNSYAPFTSETNSVYYAIRTASFGSCRAIKETCPGSPDGNYNIKPDGSDETLNVYCDMTTDGGGWTLVYVYGFTNYNHFNSGSNSASPRPAWPSTDVHDCSSPVSTTPPPTPTTHGAVDFPLWKKFGRDVLVKSNINNLLKCAPATGSMVDWIAGSISCTILDDSVAPCPSGTVKVPNRFGVGYGNPPLGVGPVLHESSSYSNLYYSFTCKDPGYWGPHDPCGRAGTNQKQGVSDPYSSIYIR